MALGDAAYIEEVEVGEEREDREGLSEEALDMIKCLEEMLEAEEQARAQEGVVLDDGDGDVVPDDGNGDEDVSDRDGGLSDVVPDDEQDQEVEGNARKEDLAEVAANRRRQRGKLRFIPW